MPNLVRFFLWIIIVVVVVAGLIAWLKPSTPAGTVNTRLRDRRVLDWIYTSNQDPEWAVKAGQRCGSAPFQMPTDGFIGYLWDDSFRPGHRHQGIDVFGGVRAGDTAIYAASDGYLSRQQDWKSTVVIRVPDDPLRPGRQIWTYYTHMADADGRSLIVPDFPLGSQEVFVQAGTLLGYQGDYSGTPGRPVGVHLHFSIVLDDGHGQILNELDIDNTLDPSPYLGLNLNAHKNQGEIPLCPPDSEGAT
jgi:peptidoglycan LD-endopeptidase LytH